MSDRAHSAEHDAWLREALRHAPDAELAPPQRLRAQILREASEATNGGLAAAANPARWFGALFERPVWATGFASAFVAVIAVMVWSPWSGAPDPASVAALPSSPATVASQPPAADTTVIARAEPPREAKAADPRAPRAPERGDRAKARPEAAAAPAALPPATPPAVAVAPAEPSAPAPAAAPAAAEAQRRAATTTASRAMADADNAGATTAMAQKPRSDEPSPLDAPRRGLRTEPDQWTWQRGSADPAPVNDALRQWLDKLAAATAGSWETIRTDPANARGLATLTLLREERIHTIVRIETDGVSRRGAVRMRAPLDPAVASSLARELGQIAP